MMVDKNRKLFDLDILVHHLSSGNTDSPTLSIHVDKKFMIELLLLDIQRF